MYRIILAEEDSNMRNDIARKINWNSYGFDLIGTYENGKQVVEAMELLPADAIITDINMSVMDGLELSRKTREKWPHCKIVILTKRNDFNAVRFAISCQVYEYIRKPITTNQLYVLLNKLRAELDAQRALKVGGGQALIAKNILLNPNSEREIAELRRDIMRKVKILDKDGAVYALERFVLSIKQFALNDDAIMARLNDLGLRLMECEAEQSMYVSSNICETLSKQLDMDSACEYLKHHLTEIIGENKRLTDRSSRHGALAVEYIKEHYMQRDISIKHMTSLLSVSNSYFSTLFKNYTGTTFIDFLTKIRVDKAKELLLTTDKKNFEIAAAIGYEDPGYFRQIFKKYTGLNPSELRKNNKRTSST